MLGPSGFFLPSVTENPKSYTNDIELIHSSEEGFSELYRICKEGRFFVYKALKKQYRGILMYEELLKKDFNIGFSLSHSGVCQYFAKIQHPAIGNCIVMEWIDGYTLEELIKASKIDSKLCEKIIYEICDALEYIHRKQIIHRDLKPENIMITHNGQNVKIIDFGLSDADSYGTFKAPAGTRHYAAPELIAGEQADIRSDIWSFGVIINELTSRYRHISSRCLKHNKDQRYSSAGEIKTAIKNASSRRLYHLAVVLSIATIASIIYFSTTDAEQGQGQAQTQTQTQAQTDSLPEAERSSNTTLPSQTPVSVAQEQSTAEPEAKVTPTKNPAAKSQDTPPDDYIDESDLDQLFKEVAASIL